MRQSTPHVYFYSTFEPAEPWRAALAAQLPAMVWSEGPECEDPASVDVALVSRPPPGGFAAFRSLKAILSLSAGVNRFSTHTVPAGVPLARSVDPSLTRHMVTYAKAAVLRYHRRFHLYEKDTRARRWNFAAPLLPGDTPIAVLGLGTLGSSIARSLVDEGFPVHGWSSSEKALEGMQTFSGPTGLMDAVRGMEIVLNVLPLTDATRNILCASVFEQMRRGGFIINMGRGAHLAEGDLITALAAGQLGGATLDVATAEPLPADHVLWSHPDIFITPHVAGMTTPATAAVQLAENIRRAVEGRPLLNRVDLARGY